MNNIKYLNKFFSKLRNKFSIISKDKLFIKGLIEIIYQDKNGKIILIQKDNIVLEAIKKKVIDSFYTGSINKIFRMAIGDNGTITGDPFTPKIPAETDTGLYHEVYRKDIDWPPIIDPGGKKITFQGTFQSIDIPSTSWMNAAQQRINEALLVAGDGVLGGGDVWAPNLPDADEFAIAKRTFKSISFEAALDMIITIKWSLFIE
jgi:hypothetical protein